MTLSLKVESSPFCLPSHSKCNLSDFSGRIFKVISQNTDLIQSVSYTTWHTLIFVSRFFKEIPDSIGHASKCILSLHSYIPISINLNFQDLSKHFHDAKNSFLTRDKISMLLTSLKVMAKSVDIFLILGGTAAAFASLAGMALVASMLYQLMIPLGIASLGVAIFFDIYDYVENKALIGRVKNLQESEIDAVTMQVIRALNHKPNPGETLGSRIVRQIDTFTLNGLSEFSWNKVTGALDLTHEIKSRHLIKRAIGYLTLFLCRMYPDTLFQSSLQLGMSLYYTLDLAYTKWRRA